MSVKSLIQIVLLLLIILIIGGIYYQFFFKNRNNNLAVNKSNVEVITKDKSKEIPKIDQDILEDIKQSQKQLDDKKDLSNNSKNEKKNLSKNNSNKLNNTTKEIEYFTTNKNGDIFKIFAEYGKTNIESTDVLDLEIVSGSISSKERSEIFIKSDFAKYNYSNQNSKFYNRVKINYDNKEITCDNLELILKDNIAIAYGNVLVKDGKSIIKANTITMDTVTKDIVINSENKVKVNTN